VVKNIVGGKRMGGNYWYKDDGTGYSQTCMDDKHSGICNKPYELSFPSALDKALRTDNFPLSGQVLYGKPANPMITPKALHTIPTGAVYNQMSPPNHSETDDNSHEGFASVQPGNPRDNVRGTCGMPPQVISLKKNGSPFPPIFKLMYPSCRTVAHI